MVRYDLMTNEELQEVIERKRKVIERKELHIQQLEFTAKECLDILAENNWRGDLQDEIKELTGA